MPKKTTTETTTETAKKTAAKTTAKPAAGKKTGSRKTAPTGRTEMAFQAEVGRLLDIVANSLYSNREIFLRELISNASDACDRLRYAALTQPELTAGDPEFRITITPERVTEGEAGGEAGDEARAGILSVADNGIGMNREDLVENLGTIARSGTRSFLEQIEEAQKSAKSGKGAASAEMSLIGQFGVGFYAAFMAADEVEVLTRKAGEEAGWRWTSDGHSGFTVEESAEAPARGTVVRLKLKDDAGEFLEAERLRQIVRAYSDHIAVPVELKDPANTEAEAERLNTASALWTRPKSEIDQQQYTEFYHHVAHAFDEPWMTLHFKAEGMVEYTGLLFIPSTKPFDLFHPERKHHVKLYVKRVFITDDCEELLPGYLRFLRGVIDSEDLPLNISRELLQHNPMLARIRKAVTRRVLGELEKKAEKEPDAYVKFWETFGAVLKEGLYEDADQREALLKLARFRSTRATGDGEGDARAGGWTSLADYVSRMRPGQEAIYFISGDDLESAANSPQIEGFRAKGVEVLLLTDPVDDFWISAVGEYDGKPLRSVTRGAGADLSKIAEPEGAAKESADGEDAGEADCGTVVAFMKQSLEGRVKDVRRSETLRESPVCLVAGEGDMDIHLERLLRQHGQIDRAATRILEINPRHALIRHLASRLKAGGAAGDDRLADAVHVLLDQARIQEGELPEDRAGFARRLATLMAQAFADPTTSESAAGGEPEKAAE